MSADGYVVKKRSSQRKPLYVYLDAVKAMSLLHRAHYETSLRDRRLLGEAVDDVVAFLELSNDLRYERLHELPDVEEDDDHYTETEVE